MHEELDGDAAGDRDGDGLGDADEEERGDTGGHLDGLVDRVLHEPVESVEARHAVVHGMETPQSTEAVAGGVGEGDAGVEHQHRTEDLNDEGQVARPQVGERERAGEQREQRNAGDVEGFVEDGVEEVVAGVASVDVPVGLVGRGGRL